MRNIINTNYVIWRNATFTLALHLARTLTKMRTGLTDWRTHTGNEKCFVPSRHGTLATAICWESMNSLCQTSIDALQERWCMVLTKVPWVYTESDDVGKAWERGYETVGDFRWPTNIVSHGKTFHSAKNRLGTRLLQTPAALWDTSTVVINFHSLS